MPTQVDIPNVGMVEFPDGMDDAAISETIKSKILPGVRINNQYAPPAAATTHVPVIRPKVGAFQPDMLQARLGKDQATPDLPVTSLGQQLKESWQAPEFIRDWEPEGQLGRVDKAVLGTLADPTTIASALPVMGALKVGSMAGKVLPAAADVMKAAVLAPFIAQGLGMVAQGGGQVAGGVSGGTPISDPSMTQPLADIALGGSMTLPIMDNTSPKVEPLATPEWLKAQPQRELTPAERNVRVATLTPSSSARSSSLTPDALLKAASITAGVNPLIVKTPQGDVQIAPFKPLATDAANLENLSPADLAKSAAANSSLNPGWGDLARMKEVADAQGAARKAKQLDPSLPTFARPGQRFGDLARIADQVQPILMGDLPAQTAPAEAPFNTEMKSTGEVIPAVKPILDESALSLASQKTLSDPDLAANEKGHDAWHAMNNALMQIKGWSGKGKITSEQRIALLTEANNIWRSHKTQADSVTALDALKQKVTELRKQNEQTSIQVTQQQNAVGGTEEVKGRTVEGKKGEVKGEVSGNDGGTVGQARGGNQPGVQGLPTGGAGLDPTYPLSTSVHEGKMVDAEGRTVDPVTRKTTGESGFVLVPKDLIARLGFQGSTKVNPAQMMNRIKNVLGDTSEQFKYLQSVGLGQFLSQPRSAEELKQWGNAQGDKQVQVHTYGMEGKVSEAKKEYDKMTHEWRDEYDSQTQRAIGQYLSGGMKSLTTEQHDILDKLSPEDSQKLDTYNKLWQNVKNEPADTSPRATSHYSSVSALPTDEPMPEWTATKSGKNVQRVDVVVPQKETQGSKVHPKTGEPLRDVKYKENPLWRQDNLHENLPNTLGWAMIQYKTGPKGEKIAVIPELQARWAQEKRKYWETYKKTKEEMVKEGRATPEQIEQHAHQEAVNSVQQYRPGMDHALADNPYRLILKAAIEQARKEGATHIMVSDAETAMMTEGHDAQAAAQTRGVAQYNEQGKLVPSKPKIDQEPGMRLNYDTILPKIAEELTGSKGEKVSLGEHKNAFVDEEKASQSQEELASELQEKIEEGELTEDEAQIELRKILQRDDLIFRNADGTPKTDVSGLMYEIGKKNPTPEFSVMGKDKGEGGWVLGLPAIMDAIKDKWSKGINTDILSEVMGSDVIKAAYLRQAGHDVPNTLIRSPKVADALVRYATADSAGRAIGKSMMTDVLGKHANDEQFRKQLGGLIYEDMRQGAGGIGNSVLSLKNSPFTDQAMLDAAMKNPEYIAALQRWKDTIQKTATEQHLKLGGTLANVGATTGTFANLIAVLDEPKYEGNGMSRGSPFATLKKGSAFSQERKFTGKEYNLDARDMGERMIHRNYAEVKKHDLYKTIEDEGLGKIMEPNEPIPEGSASIPISRRSLVILKEGEKPVMREVSKKLAVDRAILPEIKQAFQTDGPLQRSALILLGNIATKLQVGLGIDFGVHAFNDVTALDNAARQKVGQSVFGVKQVDTIMRLKKSVSQVLSDSPEIQKEIAKMAEQGVSFRGATGGWSSRALSVIDLATRLSLNRLFDEGVASGAFRDTPADRRRFVSGQAGQYNQRLMTHFQQRMMESGLGPFNVAGRNFNRLTVRRLFLSPSAKASSTVEALKMRALLALGLATSTVLTPYLANMTLTGKPTGRDGTKFGQIDLGPHFDHANGTHTVIDMAQIMGLRRAGRVTGLGKVYDEQIEPRLTGAQPAAWRQTVQDSAKDIATSIVSPYAGPLPNLASTLATGKTVTGFDQRSPGEQWPYVGATVGALNPLAGPATGLGAEGAKDTSTVARVAKKVGSIVGIRESTSPGSVITNLRRQFLYKMGKAKDADFAPSEVDPLKVALASGDVASAQKAYQTVLASKVEAHKNEKDPMHEAKMDLQTYFTKYANAHGQANEADEKVFVSTLTPHQLDLYTKAKAQQKAISDTFFSEIQPKLPRKVKW